MTAGQGHQRRIFPVLLIRQSMPGSATQTLHRAGVLRQGQPQKPFAFGRVADRGDSSSPFSPAFLAGGPACLTGLQDFFGGHDIDRSIDIHI